jgi:AraC family transcriptional regulator
MTPIIKQLPEKRLVGKMLTMNLTNNKIGILWQSFMPRKNEIHNSTNTDLISMAIYRPDYFVDFSPETEFERWAAVEVADFINVPSDLDTFIIPSGLYAVFHYKGLSTDNSIFQYIFGTWLPNSTYLLADRPHFEVLGEGYKNNDPTSEEEIWIPIQPKS